MNAADVANKFKEVDDCTAVEAVIGYAYKIAPGIAQSALDEIEELRNKVAAYEADAPAAKLARAEAREAVLLKRINGMETDIISGGIYIDCQECDGNGIVLASRNDPEAKEAKCTYCDNGIMQFKCEKI